MPKDPMENKATVEALSQQTKQELKNQASRTAVTARSPLDSLALIGLMFIDKLLDVTLEEIEEAGKARKR